MQERSGAGSGQAISEAGKAVAVAGATAALVEAALNEEQLETWKAKEQGDCDVKDVITGEVFDTARKVEREVIRSAAQQTAARWRLPSETLASGAPAQTTGAVNGALATGGTGATAGEAGGAAAASEATSAQCDKGDGPVEAAAANSTKAMAHDTSGTAPASSTGAAGTQKSRNKSDLQSNLKKLKVGLLQ